MNSKKIPLAQCLSGIFSSLGWAAISNFFDYSYSFLLDPFEPVATLIQLTVMYLIFAISSKLLHKVYS